MTFLHYLRELYEARAVQALLGSSLAILPIGILASWPEWKILGTLLLGWAIAMGLNLVFRNPDKPLWPRLKLRR